MNTLVLWTPLGTETAWWPGRSLYSGVEMTVADVELEASELCSEMLTSQELDTQGLALAGRKDREAHYGGAPRGRGEAFSYVINVLNWHSQTVVS